MNLEPTVLALTALALLSACETTTMHRKSHRVEREPFGTVEGRAVERFTLTNSNDRVCRITNWGATVTELWVPDRAGAAADVVLGFDTLAAYRERSPYFGCIVGRVANRIAHGRFVLGGRTFDLATNDGRHHLHGGERGFDRRVWDAEVVTREEGPALRLTYSSPEDEEGYPGRLDAEVVYVWTDDDELRVEMRATADRETPVNLAHHAYWNLGGHGSGSILDHELQLHAGHTTPTDGDRIPTGALEPVDGTPFDFRVPKPIGDDLPPGDPPGYDRNWVVDGEPGVLRPVARVRDPASGRVLELLGDQPGVQFYSGNFLDGVAGKGGASYERHGGLCLETQRFPDAVNQGHRPGWPSPWLAPGATYEHVMVHRFTVE